MPVMTRLTLLALVTPALCLTGAERIAQASTVDSSASQLSIASTEQAAQVEAALTRNPDDLNARGALMAFYSNEGDQAGLEKQMLWMIEHHPEAGQLSDLYSAEDDPQLEAAWD